MCEQMNIISLGAGVQSSTMALMAKHGEITPMPDAAIFADTMAEPKNVYDWLDYLEKQLPYPVFRVTAGNLEEEILKVRTKKNGEKSIRLNIPVRSLAPDGRKGMVQRQCTMDFKIVPIKRKARELSKGKKLTMWLGISYDEVQRMKPSRVKYITHIWPLIDKKMTRQACLKWIESHGYPTPPRSACYFCPFHSKHEWMGLSEHDKQRSIDFETRLQELVKQVPGIISVPYLTSTFKPIKEMFDAPKEADLFDNQFINECEGHCGV